MADKNKKDKNQHIQVFVRVRPLNQNERNKSSPCIIETGNKEVVVKERPLEKVSRTFAYDRVFGMESKQIEVYKEVVGPLIKEVLAGYNCTVFAYGQTGTGKTFTMEGVQSDNVNCNWDSDPSSGIIPRTLSHLFDELRVLQAEYTVRVSFLELYNEELFDLLSPTDDVSKIKLYEDVNKKGSVIISGLEEITVHNKNEVYKIMEKGSIKRQTAATLMNAHSSRSHTVFSITVHIKENSVDGEELLKTGKLNLVDLAGSENVGKSGAIDKRAREAGNINQSLLTLGRCITSLVERTPHIPFRESKLTRLLQDSLGGRTKTSIIATISPAACNMEETLSTLDYALRAKNITNRPEINQKLTKKALLKEYTEEIERLRRDLAATRDKNGVYLANENYTDMIQRLESQEQEIIAKIANLKAVNDEKENKQALLNQLQISLDEKIEELEQTTEVLTRTREVLGQTKNELKATTEDRDEHLHLVEKHVKTEQKLGQEAKDLLAVADHATTDTYRLHDKLSRKRSVDDTNAQISREFQQEYHQKLAHMVNDVGQFSEEQIKCFATLQSKLGLHLESGSTGLVTASELMALLVQTFNQQAVELQTKMTEQASSTQEWVQQYLISKRTRSDTEGSNLHEYRVELMPKSQNLARHVQTLESSHHEHSHHVNQQLSHQREKVEDHSAAQNLRLTQFRDVVEQLVQAQRVENDRTHSAVVQFKDKVIAKQDKLIDELTDVLERTKQILEKVKSEKLGNHSFAEIDVGYSRTVENCDKISHAVVGAMDIEGKHVHQFKKVYLNDVNDLSEEVNGFVEKSLGCVADVQRVRADIESVTSEALLNGEEAWKEDYSLCERELRQRSEMVNAQLQEQQNSIQEHLHKARGAADRHESTLERQRAELGSFVRDAREHIDDQVTHVNEWTQSTSHEVHRRDQEVGKFIAEDLRCDVPTGATPVRREFQYSRELSATSPHERIVARFRASRLQNVEDEAEQATSDDSGEIFNSSEEVEEVVVLPAVDFVSISRAASTSDIPSSTVTSVDLNLSVSSEPGYKHENKENGRSLFLQPLPMKNIRNVASKKSGKNVNKPKPQSGRKSPLTPASNNQQ